MGAAFHLKGSFESLAAETAQLWEAGCQGIAQEGDELVAYFDAPVELPVAGYWREVDEVDWLEHYYRDLKPVALDRLIIAPSHRRLEPSHKKIIKLDPGMAFGTGHHETTRLALRGLEALELTQKRVLDVGSGSGILAIAADLLGAGEALGIDIDPQTIPVAQTNAKENGSSAQFCLATLDQTVASASIDVLVANLYAELHAELASAYARVLRPGGALLATGILRERFSVAERAIAAELEGLHTVWEGEWALIAAQKPGALP